MWGLREARRYSGEPGGEVAQTWPAVTRQPQVSRALLPRPSLARLRGSECTRVPPWNLESLPEPDTPGGARMECQRVDVPSWHGGQTRGHRVLPSACPAPAPEKVPRMGRGLPRVPKPASPCSVPGDRAYVSGGGWRGPTKSHKATSRLPNGEAGPAGESRLSLQPHTELSRARDREAKRTQD